MYRLFQSAVQAATAVILLVTPNVLRAEKYMIDPSHTSIIFGISHLGYSYTYGRFSIDKASNFVWDKANPSASQFQLAIPVSSIDTNDAQRDDHLRNADFFNAKQFPQIIFQSTSVRPAQANPSGFTHELVGNLNMHGVTKQITLPLKKMGEGTGPYGKISQWLLLPNHRQAQRVRHDQNAPPYRRSGGNHDQF